MSISMERSCYGLTCTGRRRRNVPSLGLIGCGLMGASIGLGARARGWAVLGYDAAPAAAREAIDYGAIDRAAGRDEVYASSDIVVIAAHISGTLDEIARLHERPKRSGRIVLDVASIKGPIADAARGIAEFVPTHPMAGSERTGAAAARGDLFTGRTWCYVPSADEARVARVRDFIALLGAVPLAVDADRHDRVVAFTSHLPQWIAYAFAERYESEQTDRELFSALCGPAASELLRLGRSSRAMWDDIFAYNEPALCLEIDAMRERLK